MKAYVVTDRMNKGPNKEFYSIDDARVGAVAYLKKHDVGKVTIHQVEYQRMGFQHYNRTGRWMYRGDVCLNYHGQGMFIKGNIGQIIYPSGKIGPKQKILG